MTLIDVVTVPVAVARAVVGSRWATVTASDNPHVASHEEKKVLAAYQQAVTSKWARGLRYANGEQLRLLQQPVDAVLEEMAEVDAKAAVIRPVEQFAELLRKHAVMAAQEEAQAAERATEKAAEDKTRYRLDRVKRRQRTMSGLLEAGRWEEFREICEDYGLDRKDPRIMAAMIAAYHVGAERFRDVTTGLTYADPPEIPRDQLNKLIARDKAIFHKAAEAAHPQEQQA